MLGAVLCLVLLCCAGAWTDMDGDSPAAPKRPRGPESSASNASGKKVPETTSAGSQSSKLCFAEDCPDPRCRNQKWCTRHKRAYAAMHAAAKKNDQEEAFQEVMGCETRAKLAMRDWCEENPVDSKWSRKKLMDYTQYQETHGQNSYLGEMEGDRPKTEVEFLHWAENVKRLTPTGARNWWEELLRTCKRDDLGRDANGKLGALRLWVPCEELDERKKGRYTDNKVTRGSKQMKKLKDDDVSDLQDFAANRVVDEDFLRGNPRKRAAPSTPGDDDIDKPATKKLDGSEAPPSNVSPVKVVDLALEKPKVINKQTAELTAIKAALLEVAKKAAEHFKSVSGEGPGTLQALLEHLKFRLSCVAALFEYDMGKVDFLVDLFPEGQPSMEALLQSNTDKLPVPEEYVPQISQSFVQVATSFQDINKNAATVAALEDAKDNWFKLKTGFKTFEKGLSQAVKDSKANKAQQDKEKARQQKADQKKREQAELDAFRQTNDERAKAIIEDKKKALTKPAYKACCSFQEMMQKQVFEEGLKVHPFAKVEPGHLADMSKPWVAVDHQSVKVWITDAVMHKTTQSWAIKYKSFTDYVQKGRVAATLEPKHGHEQTQSLFRAFVPELADMSSISAASTFQQTTWLTGFAPDMRFAGFQSNGCLTAKAGILGDTLHVCLKVF